MKDRRFFAANARVAHRALEGQTTAPHFTDGTRMRIKAPWADLLNAPNGNRDKQMMFGHAFIVLDIHAGWAFGFDPSDGYVGYLRAIDLDTPKEATHRVIQPLSHVYSAPDIKSAEKHALAFGSALCVARTRDNFAQLETGGYVPMQHVTPVELTASDPVAVAERFLNVPYLWGGNTGAGIDCSGLVVLAMVSAGLGFPRDSDLQALLGTPVSDLSSLQRGDLVCWRGHIGMMQSETMLLHANAFHMAVASEPLTTARQRIAQGEFGEITTIRRL